MLSYDDVHHHLVKSSGSASSHPCAACEVAPAKDWAYQYNSDNELMTEDGSLYSEDPACYAPLCRKCHRRLDMELSYRLQEALHSLGLKQVEFLSALRASDPEFAAKMKEVGQRLGAYTTARRKSDPEFAKRLLEAEKRNILVALQATRDRMKDPEFAAKVRQDRAKAARVANAIQRTCECGITAHPAAIGAHQKGSGHTRYTDQ
jgi:hypothetical protein